MKKMLCMVLLLLLVLSLFSLSGCSLFKKTKPLEIVKTYPKETAPSQIVKTENHWVMLLSTYGSQNYTISVGENLDSANSVYSVKDVSIWYFEANEKGVVWCEKSKTFYTYKAYIFETQTVETVFQVTAGDDYQPQNVGIFRNNVYYCIIDYEKQMVNVFAYDLDSKTLTALHTAPLHEEQQPYSINLENGHLSFVCSDKIQVLNLQNKETVFDSPIPSTVEHVFTASYDSKNDTCALYYADNDSEDIGILKEGETKLTSVFTFSKNHYAYMDKIECYDGHIYWIAQANVTGQVTDHYQLADYNYLQRTAVETDRAFDFCRDGSQLYILRFNKDGDYTHIDLCQN